MNDQESELCFEQNTGFNLQSKKAAGPCNHNSLDKNKGYAVNFAQIEYNH